MLNPRVKLSLFCDVNVDEAGNVVSLAYGPGKNVGLGRLREALGQNSPTKKWSWKHLEGVAAKIKVEQRITADGTFAQVARDGVVAL